MAVATGSSSRRATTMWASPSETMGRLVEEVGEDLGRHAVGPVGLGVRPHRSRPGPASSSTQAHGKVGGRRDLGQGARQSISGVGSSESLEAGGPAGRRRSSSSPLSRTLMLKPRARPLKDARPCRPGGPVEGVVGAEGPVGHNRDPGSAGAQHGPVALLERTVAPQRVSARLNTMRLRWASCAPRAIRRSCDCTPRAGDGPQLGHAPSCRSDPPVRCPKSGARGGFPAALLPPGTIATSHDALVTGSLTVDQGDEPVVVKGPPPPMSEPVACGAGPEVTLLVGMPVASAGNCNFIPG